MKTKVKVIIVSVIAIILVGCIAFLSSDFLAYKKAAEAYKTIDEAYNNVNEFSHDIYEAWFKGINENDEIKGKTGSRYSSYDYIEGLEYLVEDMNISLEDIKKGVMYSYYGEDEVPAEYTDDDVEEAYKSLFYRYTDKFSAVINLVVKTYEVTGRTAKIEMLLDSAKDSMKSMSKAYADYVHYPDLKNYLTNTRAMFDFCCNPEGSFEQVVETFNNYRNQSRECYFALDYIFEE